ncbi:hypothetical protein RAD15_25565 [Bradyrhizobium sp. 14AA]
MHIPPSSFAYGVFVEAPDDLESLQAEALKFDPDFQMYYLDNGMEFRFNDRVAATKFLLVSGGTSSRLLLRMR